MKHFSQSPKSSEMLNNVLSALELNNVHMLVWGGTRMSWFLDACKQTSNILSPFLDTLVTGNIRPEETSFFLRLMADIHPISANQYLHKVDSDTVLSCESKGIAKETVEKLQQMEADRSTEVVESLYSDENKNMCQNQRY